MCELHGLKIKKPSVRWTCTVHADFSVKNEEWINEDDDDDDEIVFYLLVVNGFDVQIKWNDPLKESVALLIPFKSVELNETERTKSIEERKKN